MDKAVMDLARMNAERGLNGPLRILDKQRRRCVTLNEPWTRPSAPLAANELDALLFLPVALPPLFSHAGQACERPDCSRYRWCRARIGAGRLVRSAMGRLLSRGLRWCWFPIGKLRRTCIRYDRCRRRLVCGQPWIGKLAGLKQVVKAEPEEAAYEHADSKIECNHYPTFFCLRIPRRAHRLTASMAPALEWRDHCRFSE